MDTKKKVRLINRIIKEYYWRQLKHQEEIKNTFAPSEIFIIPSHIISDLRKWSGGK